MLTLIALEINDFLKPQRFTTCLHGPPQRGPGLNSVKLKRVRTLQKCLKIYDFCTKKASKIPIYLFKFPHFVSEGPPMCDGTPLKIFSGMALPTGLKFTPCSRW